MALFSATVSPAVHEIIQKLFADAEVIRSEGSHRIVASLTTKNRTVVDGKRFPLLKTLLAEKVTGGTLIFCNTRDQCDKLASELEQSGHPCAIYRGEMDKVERRANLKAFRDGKVGLLISTDLASRGLDVDHVGRVINYHLPQQMENYLHRVGRTARAGRPGPGDQLRHGPRPGVDRATGKRAAHGAECEFARQRLTLSTLRRTARRGRVHVEALRLVARPRARRLWQALRPPRPSGGRCAAH